MYTDDKNNYKSDGYLYLFECIMNEIFSMAFSPTQSPVYGGDTLTIALGPDQLFLTSSSSSAASLPPSLSSSSSETSKYFVVFEGTRRRHVVSARPVSGARRPVDGSTEHVAVVDSSAVDGDEDSENKDSYVRLETIIPGE
ncbi:hypothetical protein PoB_003917500 [Plakobranchus ocellatus]|uniref:Uncharacterized protein n=1 Tax=Plakobranchus ocellatus TaxID=259542 RepID=A0AAV4AWC3_9GAST|nr:hypothetical protein PoB_003917500 [Plakobranchus ocellatus]